MCYFPPPPPQAGLNAAGIFSSDGVTIVLTKSIIALTLQRKTTWMKPRHSLRVTLWHYHWDSARQNCVNECLWHPWLSFILCSFSKWGHYAFVNTADVNGTPSDEKIHNCFKLCLRGEESSTFWKWHLLSFRKIALESKRLIHIWWTWCQDYSGKEFPDANTAKINGSFNQECCWNNGSKSLHCFWATLYTQCSMFILTFFFYLFIFSFIEISYCKC